MPGRFFDHTPEVLEAFVVFERQTHAQWWLAATPRDYGHCWLFWARYYPEPGFFAQRFATKVELVLGHLHADVWMAEPEDIAELLLAQGVTDVLRIERRVQAGGRPLRGLLTCVTVVKAALSLGAWWVLTPAQLYVYLRRHGARSLGEESRT